MLFSIIPLVSFLAFTHAAYDTYPSVAKTASINGFADQIYDRLPSCAQECVKESTSSTPCPYWDAGCLCVMNVFASNIANCFAESCVGSDVQSAQSLATSICSSAGVDSPYWYIDSSASAALAAAATEVATEEVITTETSASMSAADSGVNTYTNEIAASTSEIVGTASTSAAVTKVTHSSSYAQPKATDSSILEADSSAHSYLLFSSSTASSAPSVSSVFNAAGSHVPAAAAFMVAGFAMLI